MTEANDSPAEKRRPSSGLTRAAIWLGGSALFGSLALVLWNRRALKSLHEAEPVTDEPVWLGDDDIY